MRVLLLLAALAPARAAADEDALRKAVTFYASFDEAVRADVGAGGRSLSTRFNHKTEMGKFVFEPGYPERVFRIARGKGVHGGALEATDILPDNGRVFFPAKGNIAFDKGGWGGAVSLWIDTDPNVLIKAKFCDPIQITQKGANNGGLWIDFNDAKPRDLRHGCFPAVPPGKQPIKEDDPAAPMVRVPKVGFKVGEWHHLVLSWKNLDTDKEDAVSELYIDGKRIGSVKDRAIEMAWDLEKTGIYVAVNYVGLLDELAVFNRPLTADEVTALYRTPGLLSKLKKQARGPAPVPPPFPFEAATARRYQAAYAEWAGLPVEKVNELGMRFVLVPPGKFLMGSPADEPGHGTGGYDETRHEVTLTKPFYLGKHEVTAGQFRRFVDRTGHKTDGEKKGGGHAHDARAVWIHRPGLSWRKPGYPAPFVLEADHPVVQVSHADAKAFCGWLQAQAPAGWTCDLPTEAQWEWACRAGAGGRFWWGPDEDRTGKRVNVGDRTLKRVHPDWPRSTVGDDGQAFAAKVGSYEANAFGLYDMLGNIWEFCSTRYGAYGRGPATDPGDLDPKRGFAVRGGGWSNEVKDVRCATRNADPPHFTHSNLGFRVALQMGDQGRARHER